MASSMDLKNTATHPAMDWSKWFSTVVEDTARSLVGFLSNGLNDVYNGVFKRIPLFGNLFAHPWVEQVIKLCSGITIGQGLANDVARYVFKPIGFVMGFLLGNFGMKKVPTYNGQIGRVLNQLAGPTVGGALVGLGAYASASALTTNQASWSQTDPLNAMLLLATGGALLGLIGKTMVLYAIHFVNRTNQETTQKNVLLARKLGTNLKMAARQQAKGRILTQAQDIIQQMNGAISQQYLELFFKEQYEQIASSTNKQIDRHFNYLVDRACHGDIKALEKLKALNPVEKSKGKNTFEVMLDRMFNKRANLKIKDDVDTVFDRWQYRHLRAAT